MIHKRDRHTQRQTDKHTHTDTTWRHRPRLCIASCSKSRPKPNRNKKKKSILHIPSFSRKFSCSWEFSTRVQHNVELVKATHDQPTNQRHYLQRLSQYLHVLIATRSEKLIPATQPTRSLAVLNILLSHSKVTQGHSKWLRWVGRVYIPISISLKLCLYVVPFMRYSASKNGVTLILGVGVVQSHWKWHRLIDHIWLSIGRPL